MVARGCAAGSVTHLTGVPSSHLLLDPTLPHVLLVSITRGWGKKQGWGRYNCCSMSPPLSLERLWNEARCLGTVSSVPWEAECSQGEQGGIGIAPQHWSSRTFVPRNRSQLARPACLSCSSPGGQCPSWPGRGKAILLKGQKGRLQSPWG